MAVGFLKAAASHTAGGSFSVSQASFTWALGIAGDTPAGILVLVGQGVANADSVTSVTYGPGNTNIPSVSGGRAEDTAGEPGSFEAYFLGSGVPSGAASVIVNRTSNTTTMWAVGILISATTDTEIYLPGIVLTQNNAAPAEQSVNDGSPGTNSMRFAGVYYGGATPAPAGTSSTQLVSGGVSSGPGDATAYGWNVVRETAAGQGARSVGCVNATSDDNASVHLAVRELVVVNATVTPSVVAVTTTLPAAAVTEYAPALELSGFTITGPGSSDTIEWVQVAVAQFQSSALMGAPRLELWDGTSAQIGADASGTHTTSTANVDTFTIAGVTYSQLATLRVRVYANSGTAAAGATQSVDSAGLTVCYSPASGGATNATVPMGSALAVATARPAPAVTATSNATVTLASALAVATAKPLPAVTAVSNAATTPATVAAPAAQPLPTVTATSNAAAAPATLTAATTAPVPAVTAGGSATAAPATLAVPAAFPAPVVRQDQAITPDVLAVTTAQPSVVIPAGTPGLIQYKQGSSATGTLTITLDAPTTTGNGLIVFAAASGTSTNPTSVSAMTLGGSADHFAQAATAGGPSDAAIIACWLDLNCAGGQTSVVITAAGGSGTLAMTGTVYERSDLTATSAFDNSHPGVSAGSASWSSGATATTAQAAEVWAGAVFTAASGAGTITGPSAPWSNLAQISQVQGSFADRWMSGWQAVATTGAATYSGTVSPSSQYVALAVTLKQAVAATVTMGSALAVATTWPTVTVTTFTDATVTPATLAVTTSVPAPAVRQDRTVTPATLTAATTAPVPAVTAGGSATAAPATLAAGTGQPAVTILAYPETSPALELSGFGTFSAIGSGDTIEWIRVAVTEHQSTALMAACMFELWDGASARIGAVQTGTASTSTGNVSTATFTGVTYAMLATLRVRVYGHSGTAAPGATQSVDSAALTVSYSPSDSGNATATPATLAAATTAPVPAVTAGSSATAAPATLAITTTAPAPVVRQDKTATPATLAVTSTIPAPAVTTTGNATATPATLAAATTQPPPTVTATGLKNSPALELSGFTITGPASGDTINSVTVAVTEHQDSASAQACTFELWDYSGTPAQIGTTQTGTASTSTSNVSSATFTGVDYPMLATLRVRVYGHSGTGYTESVDGASLAVTYTPAPLTTVTPATLAVATTAPAVTVTVTASANPAPATVAVTTSAPVPAVTAGGSASVTPATLTAATAQPAAAATAGTGTVTAPATLAVTTTAPAPVVRQDASPAPAVKAVTSTIPAPAVVAGGSATTAPATLAVTTAQPAPVVRQDQAVTVTGLAAATAAPVPAVIVTSSANAAPATLAATTAQPAATVTTSTSATAAPATLTVTAAFPQSAASACGSAAAAPAVLAAAVTIPAPVVRQDRTLIPAVVTVTVTIPAPAAAGGANPAPATLTILAAFPARTVSTGMTAAPSVVAVTVDIPQATRPATFGTALATGTLLTAATPSGAALTTATASSSGTPIAIAGGQP